MSAVTVYILLFRGVGGKTQLPTQPLREALSALGFDNVGTYINSGNAYLKTSMPRAEVLRLTRVVCAEKFAFTKDVYAVSLPEWSKLIAKVRSRGSARQEARRQVPYSAACPRCARRGH